MLQAFTIPAGGRQVDAKADFFRYDAAVSNGADESLRVRVDGADLGTYLPGDAITLPAAGKTWEVVPVSPTVTCSIRLGLGRIESNRIAGATDIQNKIGAGVALANASLPSVFGFSALQVLAPASNVRGVRVRNVLATATGGVGNAEVILLAAPSTPASKAPANAIWLAQAFSPSNTVTKEYSKFDVNVTLPPGWGIWACTAHGGASGAIAGYACAYELL